MHVRLVRQHEQLVTAIEKRKMDLADLSYKAGLGLLFSACVVELNLGACLGACMGLSSPSKGAQKVERGR